MITEEAPQIRSVRVFLRQPQSEDVETRLFRQDQEGAKAYGGTFNPVPFYTQTQAEAVIAFTQEQGNAWAIDTRGIIGRVP